VFSYMEGILHSYYMIALAPAIAALVGVGTLALWRRRHDLVARAALAGGVLLTAGWSFALLARTPDWHPWLRYAVLVAGLVGGLAVLLAPALDRALAKPVGVVAAVLMVVAGVAGPAAYSLDTITTAHAGALPWAGPASAGGMGGGPGMGRIPAQGAQGGTTGGTTGGQGTTRGPGAGGVGGFLGGTGTIGVSSELVTLLQQGAKGYEWAAAAVTANGAAPLQIASGTPVMAIGGFNGTDPAPTLAEFQQLVAQGKIHYFVAGGGGFGGGPGGDGTSSEISAWVQENFAAQTAGTTTVYDLTTG
jgi:4-amino-4-deoxy-L-arabinose transferase-like glycosyltransferase